MNADSLPTKRRLKEETGDLDYSLGSTVLDLGEQYTADYALLLDVYGSYATAGATFLAILSAAAAGETGTSGRRLDTGTRTGASASLVDLRNGKIIWYGTPATGVDPRTADGARKVVQGILAELPL